MFIKAAAEALPRELASAADRVTVNLPWGSLLRAVLLPEPDILQSIRGLIKSGGILEVLTAIDPVRDLQELARLGLPELTDRHFDIDLIRSYRSAGFVRVENAGFAPGVAFPVETTWGKRLSRSPERLVRRLRFTAV